MLFITGQKRGLGTKVVNNRAVEQILNQHGLERTIMNNSNWHRTVQGYKAEQRIIESRIKALELSKVKVPTPTQSKKTITGHELK